MQRLGLGVAACDMGHPYTCTSVAFPVFEGITALAYCMSGACGLAWGGSISQDGGRDRQIEVHSNTSMHRFSNTHACNVTPECNVVECTLASYQARVRTVAQPGGCLLSCMYA